MLQPICSPCHGKIESVLINESTYIYPWEKLFLIRDEKGSVREVRVATNGLIQSLEVKENQKVTPGTVLVKVQEDLIATGSD